MKIEKNGNCKIEYDFSILEKMLKELKSKHYVDVGILGGASYEGGAFIAGIGAVHEFGKLDGSIPERSWLRMPITERQKEIVKKIQPKIKEMLEDGNVKGIFELIGIECEAQIQEAFDSKGFGIWEPIKLETAKRKKGSNAILIDDGTLRESITSEVGKG